MDNLVNPSCFTFTDGKGRSWDLSLDLLTAMRIDKSDFTDITPQPICILKPEETQLGLILQDRRLLCAICYIICLPQVLNKIQISPTLVESTGNSLEDLRQQEFTSGFKGNTFAQARKALGEALADFFPEIKIITQKLNAQWERAESLIQSRLEAMGDQTEPMILQEIDRLLKPLEEAVKSQSLNSLEDAVNTIGKRGETSIVSAAR